MDCTYKGVGGWVGGREWVGGWEGVGGSGWAGGREWVGGWEGVGGSEWVGGRGVSGRVGGGEWAGGRGGWEAGGRLYIPTRLFGVAMSPRSASHRPRQDWRALKEISPTQG